MSRLMPSEEKSDHSARSVFPQGQGRTIKGPDGKLTAMGFIPLRRTGPLRMARMTAKETGKEGITCLDMEVSLFTMDNFPATQDHHKEV